MIYSLIVILGTTISSVGSYANEAACLEASQQFIRQKIVSVCVQQESPEKTAKRMLEIFRVFIKEIEK
jgi:hypothetical protein